MKPTMRIFSGSTEGKNRLGLRELLQRYADDQSMADHMMPAAAASLLGCFKRAVQQELELRDLKCTNRRPE